MQPNHPWQNLVRFYSDCYQADNRHVNFWDIFKLKKNDFEVFSGQDELANNSLPRYPINANLAQHLSNQVTTYQREKLLTYGVIFVAGTLKPENLVKNRTVCAPLIYYPAQLVNSDNITYVELSDEVHVNTPLLRSIITADNIDSVMDTFPAPKDGSHELNIGQIASWLEKFTVIEDVLPLLKYPKLASKSDLTEHAKASSVQVLSAAAVALIDRPKASRGIVHELDAIAKASHTSLPCQAILGGLQSRSANTFQQPGSASTLHAQQGTSRSGDSSQNTVNSQPEILPVQLSTAQQDALSICASQTLGLVSGPPGTGKSFTIAAMIADRVLHGEKVLVVSETEQAVEVIAEKLMSDFGIKEGVVRAGRAEYLRELKSYIDDLLKTGTRAEPKEKLTTRFQELKHKQANEHQTEALFVRRAKQSVKWGQVIAPKHPSETLGWFRRLRIKLIRYRVKRAANLWDLMEQLDQLNSQKEKMSFEYIKQIKNAQLEQTLLNSRNDLVHFNKALKARTSLKQQSFFNEIDYAVLLDAFPVWLVSLSTLHKVLPLTESLFDTVIFDEATQCNLAISIPALYRAKRAMVVGDAKQLSHVSFLSSAKEKSLLDKHGIETSQFEEHSYRNNSLLDKVSAQITHQSSVTMLDEHFRSKSDLISFSNYKFYRNRLKVMQHRPGAYENGNLVFYSCSGTRNKQGINTQEAKALIEKLCDIVQDAKPMKAKPSIGVLSPYRTQAEYLDKTIANQVSAGDIEQHNIRVGTPYQFQGEERDIMLLSFSVCENSLNASGYLNREDVFNVAITRAKQKQWVFVSVSPEKLHINNLLRQYIESPTQTTSAKETSETLDYFQDVVCHHLAKHQITTWKGYTIAGQTMDILCRKHEKFVAIDLIGFPGEWQDFYDTSSYKVFRRAGLTVVPICYADWIENSESCLSSVLANL